MRLYIVQQIAKLLFTKGMMEFKSLSALCQRCLNGFNIYPDFEVGNPISGLGAHGLEGMRHRLNTEPGLIIANHPTDIDPIILLANINRRARDLKIVAAPRWSSVYARCLGGDCFLPADRSSLPSIVEHIARGGAVFLFPSGGDRRRRNIRFGNEFPSILQRIQAECMVYSFYIEPQKIRAVIHAKPERWLRYVGMTVDMLLSSRLNINRLLERAPVLVREHYSQAREWQEALQTQPLNNRLAATQYYLSRFGLAPNTLQPEVA